MEKTPDEIDGKRYRRKYRGESIYIIVVEDVNTGLPVEVFVRFDQEGKDETKFLTEAGWDAFTRLLSKMLQSREFSLHSIVKQIKRARRIKTDLPTLISEILDMYTHLEKINGNQSDEAFEDTLS